MIASNGRTLMQQADRQRWVNPADIQDYIRAGYHVVEEPVTATLRPPTASVQTSQKTIEENE